MDAPGVHCDDELDLGLSLVFRLFTSASGAYKLVLLHELFATNLPPNLF